jgi:hypothetical protein
MSEAAGVHPLLVQLQSANGAGALIPTHVVFRLEAALAGEDAEYVDTNVDGDATGVSGQVVLVTATRWIFADLAGSREHDPAATGHRQPVIGQSTVEVHTWPRRSLESLHLGGDDFLWTGGASRWRQGARVKAVFSDKADSSVNLPLSSHPTDAVLASLERLWRDLVGDLS